MNLLATTIASSFLITLGYSPMIQAQTPSSHNAQQVEITRNGSQPSTEGSADYFTGSVRLKPLFPMHDPSRASGASVTFEPGARTAWHTHLLGQTLIVTDGSGYVQQWGRQIQEIRPEDVVWIPPGVKHWHGATATRNSRTTRRQGCGLDGTGQQRTIRGLILMLFGKVSEPQIYEVGDLLGILALLRGSFIVLMVS